MGAINWAAIRDIQFPEENANLSNVNSYPLSGAYHDGVAYGIAYYDGMGKYELIDKTFTCLKHAFEHISSIKEGYEFPARVVILRVEPLAKM